MEVVAPANDTVLPKRTFRSLATAKVQEVFRIAVEQYHPDQWSSYLDDVCRDKQERRERVELLLDAHLGHQSVLDRPAISPPTMDEPAIAAPASQIGRYKLLEQIGEGGFGVVFAAEQIERVRRKVALKVIKPGMDTNEVIARFEAERQALALLEHPNIARVIDAGKTESGRPYFAMELVHGVAALVTTLWSCWWRTYFSHGVFHRSFDATTVRSSLVIACEAAWMESMSERPTSNHGSPWRMGSSRASPAACVTRN